MRAPRVDSDAFLGTLGVLFGTCSLTYPFGRDQGLYYYVAREWVLRGSIPYRDVLDHKTPGIYVLHALTVLLFGEQMWGIRLFDLVGVVAVGVLAGSLSASPGEPVRPGVRGATVLATSVLYYGYLDFWSTAQSELWYAMFGIASVAAAVRIKSEARAALCAGLCAGSAVMMKPPAVWIVLVALSWLIRRSLMGRRDGAVPRARSRARMRAALWAVARFGAASAAAPGVILGYFAARGALPALLDIVVGANGFYVKHERGGAPGDGIREYHWCYFPLVPALLLHVLFALVRARRAGDRDGFARHFVALAICGGGYAAVAMQGKFYLLHFGVMAPAFAMIVANAARALADAASGRGRGWAFAPAFVALLGGLYAGALLSYQTPRVWWLSAQHAWRWSWGSEPRYVFVRHFQNSRAEFRYSSSEIAGDWLREHTTPEDLITVRGFQPEIYAVARRHHGGRFFWTTFLTSPARAYRREEWLREDREALIARPPKYVVVLTPIAEGPDSAAFFEPLGYRTAAVLYEFTVMERVPAAPAP